jgi:hypothetical protein
MTTLIALFPILPSNMFFGGGETMHRQIRITLTLSMSFLLLNCARQHIYHLPRTKDTMDEIKRTRADKSKIKIETEEKQYSATDLWYSDSGIVFVDRSKKQILDYNHVEQIILTEETNAAGYTVTGTVIGILAGAAVGASQPVKSDSWIDMSGIERTGNTLLGVLIGGLAGFAAGGMIEKTAGERQYYYILEGSADTMPLKSGKILTFVDDYSDSELRRITFTSIIEKGPQYLLISWQGKRIKLLRSEYKYRGEGEDGRPFIVVPESIYQRKFVTQ